MHRQLVSLYSGLLIKTYITGTKPRTFKKWDPVIFPFLLNKCANYPASSAMTKSSRTLFILELLKVVLSSVRWLDTYSVILKGK